MTAEKPETLDFLFTPPATLEGLTIWPRPKYGPAKLEVLASKDGKTYDRLVTATGEPEGPIRAGFNRTTATYFQVRITAAHDPVQKDRPRNVQVAEVVWKHGKPEAPATGGKK